MSVPIKAEIGVNKIMPYQVIAYVWVETEYYRGCLISISIPFTPTDKQSFTVLQNSIKTTNIKITISE